MIGTGMTTEFIGILLVNYKLEFLATWNFNLFTIELKFVCDYI